MDELNTFYDALKEGQMTEAMAFISDLKSKTEASSTVLPLLNKVEQQAVSLAEAQQRLIALKEKHQALVLELQKRSVEHKVQDACPLPSTRIASSAVAPSVRSTPASVLVATATVKEQDATSTSSDLLERLKQALDASDLTSLIFLKKSLLLQEFSCSAEEKAQLLKQFDAVLKKLKDVQNAQSLVTEWELKKRALLQKKASRSAVKVGAQDVFARPENMGQTPRQGAFSEKSLPSLQQRSLVVAEQNARQQSGQSSSAFTEGTLPYERSKSDQYPTQGLPDATASGVDQAVYTGRKSNIDGLGSFSTDIDRRHSLTDSVDLQSAEGDVEWRTLYHLQTEERLKRDCEKLVFARAMVPRIKSILDMLNDYARGRRQTLQTNSRRSAASVEEDFKNLDQVAQNFQEYSRLKSLGLPTDDIKARSEALDRQIHKDQGEKQETGLQALAKVFHRQNKSESQTNTEKTAEPMVACKISESSAPLASPSDKEQVPAPEDILQSQSAHGFAANDPRALGAHMMSSLSLQKNEANRFAEDSDDIAAPAPVALEEGQATVAVSAPEHEPVEATAAVMVEAPQPITKAEQNTFINERRLPKAHVASSFELACSELDAQEKTIDKDFVYALDHTVSTEGQRLAFPSITVAADEEDPISLVGNTVLQDEHVRHTVTVLLSEAVPLFTPPPANSESESVTTTAAPKSAELDAFTTDANQETGWQESTQAQKISVGEDITSNKIFTPKTDTVQAPAAHDLQAGDPEVMSVAETSSSLTLDPAFHAKDDNSLSEQAQNTQPAKPLAEECSAEPASESQLSAAVQNDLSSTKDTVETEAEPVLPPEVQLMPQIPVPLEQVGTEPQSLQPLQSWLSEQQSHTVNMPLSSVADRELKNSLAESTKGVFDVPKEVTVQPDKDEFALAAHNEQIGGDVQHSNIVNQALVSLTSSFVASSDDSDGLTDMIFGVSEYGQTDVEHSLQKSAAPEGSASVVVEDDIQPWDFNRSFAETKTSSDLQPRPEKVENKFQTVTLSEPSKTKQE